MLLGGSAWTWTVVKKILWGEPLFTDPFFSMGTFLILVGVQVLLFGLLAEITVRTYFESQNKSSWILKPKAQPRENTAPTTATQSEPAVDDGRR